MDARSILVTVALSVTTGHTVTNINVDLSEEPIRYVTEIISYIKLTFLGIKSFSNKFGLGSGRLSSEQT